MNNSTTEHDTAKLITPFQSESTALSNDINISYYEEIPKIDENSLIDVFSKFCHFCNVLKTLNTSNQ